MSSSKLPKLDELYHHETGEPGLLVGFFCIERGLYTVTLLAEHRWTTPTGRPRKRVVSRMIQGGSARQLAANMRGNGFAVPRGLGRLCESAPGNKGRR